MGFGHLKNLSVEEKTAKFEIAELNAVLIVKPATEANKPYFNKILKHTKTGRLARRKSTLSQQDIDKAREEDRELYPLHVIVGWENVRDDKNELVDFSIESCADFLRELCRYAPYIFDELLIFTKDPANFVELMDVEEKSKN